MGYKVVYFSRSGNSERIAKKIGKKLNCKVIKINSKVNWNGFTGYIKYMYYAISKKDIEINIKNKIKCMDDIILVTPLWDSKPALPTKKFLEYVSKEKVHLVTSSKSSIMKDKVNFKSITHILEKNNNEDEVIEALMNKLNG